MASQSKCWRGKTHQSLLGMSTSSGPIELYAIDTCRIIAMAPLLSTFNDEEPAMFALMLKAIICSNLNRFS
jgi:hypothetical protein